LPINEEISLRAMFLVEEHALSHNMQMADALVAASALTAGETLVTANDKHYKYLHDLDIRFRP
jgi:predicted nucleic acid-binding protein